jgi:Ca2+-binding EF-hand superfamily protein
MGARISTPSLPDEDAEALSKNTNFTRDQIQHLYRRFTFLDKDNSGTLSPGEFLAIPEFSMNPLNYRTLAMFQLQQNLNEHRKIWRRIVDTEQNLEWDTNDDREHKKINASLDSNSTQSSGFDVNEKLQIQEFFHRIERNQFINLEVDFLSFLQTLSIFSPNASLEEKARFAFLAFNTNGDGAIKPAELSLTLQNMVGDSMPKDVLNNTVNHVIAECDTIDRDGKISFEEFRNIFLERNMASKMIITL